MAITKSNDGKVCAMMRGYVGTTNKMDAYILKGTVLDACCVTFADNSGYITDITIVSEPDALSVPSGRSRTRRRCHWGMYKRKFMFKHLPVLCGWGLLLCERRY